MLDNVVFGITISLIFICLIVLFCILLVKLYIHKIKTYTKVIYDKDLKFQKTLNATIIETQEQLLTSISQDLHDDAGQQLTAINFQLENIKLDSPELFALLDPISANVSQLSTSIRNISHSLNNQLLMQQNLIKAISSEIERLRQYSKIKIELRVDENKGKAFDSNEQIVLYRIFQEIINNILKHAAANTIWVTLSNKPTFQMTVRDNGTGFDLENLKTTQNSLGLKNIEYRASVINYTANIKSSIGNGTTITLSENSHE